MAGVNRRPEAESKPGQWRFASFGCAIGLLFYLARLNTIVSQLLPAALTVCFIVFLAFVVAAVMRSPEKHANARWVLARASPVVLSFALLVLVSILGAVTLTFSVSELRVGSDQLLNMLALLAGMFAAIGVTSRTRIRVIHAALAITLGSLALDLLFPATFSQAEGRAAGLALNPNVGALTIAVLIPMVLDWELRAFRVSQFILILIGLAASLTTLSRGGIIVYLLVVIYYLALAPRTWRLRVVYSLVVVGGIVSLVLVMLIIRETAHSSAVEWSRMDMFLDRDSSLIPDRDPRLEAADMALDLIRDRPLLGYGTGYSLSTFLPPHNMYLAVWIDNGIPGICAYLSLLSALTWLAWKRRDRQLGMLTLVFIVTGLFSHNLLEDRCLVLGIGVSISQSLLVQSTGVELKNQLP